MNARDTARPGGHGRGAGKTPGAGGHGRKPPRTGKGAGSGQRWGCPPTTLIYAALAALALLLIVAVA